jgi:hypothetical protein
MEADGAWFLTLCTGISIKGLRKTTKILDQNSRCPDITSTKSLPGTNTVTPWAISVGRNNVDVRATCTWTVRSTLLPPLPRWEQTLETNSIAHYGGWCLRAHKEIPSTVTALGLKDEYFDAISHLAAKINGQVEVWLLVFLTSSLGRKEW